MKLKLENKRGSVLRIKIGIWIPSQEKYAFSFAVFDTGAYKTIVDERIATLLELPIATKEGVSIVTATGTSSTRTSILPRLMLGKKPNISQIERCWAFSLWMLINLCLLFL